MNRNINNAFKDPEATKELLANVQEVAGYLWVKGWSEKNAGNISVRLPNPIDPQLISSIDPVKMGFEVKELSNVCFYCTGTGTRMRDVAKDPLEHGVFIQISDSGNEYKKFSLSKKEVRPTSELPSHLSIHQMIAQRGTDEIVVMHTHATELVAITQFSGIKSSESLNHILWGMHPETMVFIPTGVGFVPYNLPGSLGIASATMECFKNHNLVLWEKHGVFAIGKSIIDTFDNIDIACKSARIWFQCKSAGFEPEGLTSKQLDELRELVKKFSIGC